MPSKVELRAATVGDAAFIVEMARHTCIIEDWDLPDADSEDTQTLLPRGHDVAVVAGDTTRVRLGAAWTFHHEPPLLLDAGGVALPEIAIAVTPERRGSGIGGALLDELFVRCAARYEALSLNVHKRNPASRLYERKGFRVLGQGRGTLGIVMRKDLRRSASNS
ncbi:MULTISPECIES: GNAT family N-acetyltransferase [unclassified Mycobacterium]|uniref:GNAT family N-acetyltransferase n=1 Tax=unclassified Mycobacterium TaxID=2642494 RepID=UPI0029C6DBC5|nr:MULTISPECIES: GNAT family N-acetyltransferase [unclassified Mycobacterium]